MTSPPWLRGTFTVKNAGSGVTVQSHSEALYAPNGANGFLVDVGVELYGAPCVNPSEHPAVPTTSYGLLTV